MTANDTKARALIISAAVSAVVLLLTIPESLRFGPIKILIGDELFYFFQARGLSRGDVEWFSVSSSPLLGLLLAPGFWLGEPLALVRLVMGACYVCSFALLYAFVARGAGWLPAAAAMVVLAAHPLLRYSALTIRIETFMLGLIALYYFAEHRFLAGHHFARVQLVATTVLLFVAKKSLMAFPLGLLVSAIVYRKPNLRSHPIAAAIGICVVLAIFEYRFLDNNLIGDKLYLRGDLSYLAVGVRLFFDVGPALAVVGGLALLVGAARSELGRVRLFQAVVASILLTFIRPYFVRYAIVVLVPAVVAVGERLAIGGRHRGLSALVVAGCLLTVVLQSPALYTATPSETQASYNRYVLSAEGCRDVGRLYAQCVQRVVTTPFLKQPPHSDCTYVTAVRTDLPYVTLYFSYVDDEATGTFGHHALGDFDLWSYRQIELRLPPGIHPLTLRVSNRMSGGGVGQVMVCESDERFVSPIGSAAPIL